MLNAVNWLTACQDNGFEVLETVPKLSSYQDQGGISEYCRGKSVDFQKLQTRVTATFSFSIVAVSLLLAGEGTYWWVGVWGGGSGSGSSRGSHGCCPCLRLWLWVVFIVYGCGRYNLGWAHGGHGLEGTVALPMVLPTKREVRAAGKPPHKTAAAAAAAAAAAPAWGGEGTLQLPGWLLMWTGNGCFPHCQLWSLSAATLQLAGPPYCAALTPKQSVTR